MTDSAPNPSRNAPIRYGEAALAVACGVLLAAVLQNAWGLLRHAKAASWVPALAAAAAAALGLALSVTLRRHLRRGLTDGRVVACAALALALWLAVGACFVEEGAHAPPPEAPAGREAPRPEELNADAWHAPVLRTARILGLTDAYHAWPAYALFGFLGLTSLLAALRPRTRGLASLARRAAHLGVLLVLAGATLSQLAARRARVEGSREMSVTWNSGGPPPFDLRLDRLAVEPKAVEFRPRGARGEPQYLRAAPGAGREIGGVRFEIAEYLPNAVAEEEITEAPGAARTAPPLFQMEFLPKEGELFRRHYQPRDRRPVSGPYGVEIRHARAASRAEYERLLSAPRPWPEETLVVEKLGESRKPELIPLRPRKEKIGQEISHELLGALRLHVADWAPSGTARLGHFEPERAGRASLPALQIELRGSGEAPFWVVSTPRGDRERRHTVGTLPLELRRHRFRYWAAPEPPVAVRILEGPGEPRRLVLLTDPPKAHRFEEDDVVALGHAGLRLRLVRAWRSAVKRLIARPAGEGSRGRSAVLLRARGPFPDREAWLLAGDREGRKFGPWTARLLRQAPVPERTVAEVSVLDRTGAVLASGPVRYNRPLRTGAWRVYLRRASPPAAVLSIVRDPGLFLVYPGLALVALGVLALIPLSRRARAENAREGEA